MVSPDSTGGSRGAGHGRVELAWDSGLVERIMGDWVYRLELF